MHTRIIVMYSENLTKYAATLIYRFSKSIFNFFSEFPNFNCPIL